MLPDDLSGGTIVFDGMDVGVGAVGDKTGHDDVVHLVHHYGLGLVRAAVWMGVDGAPVCRRTVR